VRDTKKIIFMLFFSSLVLLLVQTVMTEYEPQPSDEHSGLVAYDVFYGSNPGVENVVWDYELASLVSNAIAEGNPEMIFTFGVCFGGGFIDDLIKLGGDIAITSASRHYEYSYHDVGGKEGFYLKEWANALASVPTPNMLAAYNIARANDPVGPVNKALFSWALEHPQYSSVGNGDFLVLNATEESYAILFVGSIDYDDPDEYNSYWWDTWHICDVLHWVYKYNADKVYILFGNGDPGPNGDFGVGPAPGGVFTVDSAACKADLQYVFEEWLKPRIVLGGDKLFFWAGDHGAGEKGGIVNIPPDIDKRLDLAPCFMADLNSDLEVNILDVTIVAHAFGTLPGQQRWNVRADIDDNGRVDIVDVSTVAMRFGEVCIDP